MMIGTIICDILNIIYDIGTIKSNVLPIRDTIPNFPHTKV
jgi:hypothetical protein